MNRTRLGGGCPFQAMMKDGGFHRMKKKLTREKFVPEARVLPIILRKPLYFSTARPITNRQHIIDALSFELGKVEVEHDSFANGLYFESDRRTNLAQARGG